MKRNYDECVTKYSDSFVRVVLDPGYVSRIQNFVTELVEASITVINGILDSFIRQIEPNLHEIHAKHDGVFL